MEKLIVKCKCGTEVLKGTRFCPECGAKLETEPRTVEEMQAMKSEIVDAAQRIVKVNPLGGMVALTLSLFASMLMDWASGWIDDSKVRVFFSDMEEKNEKRK